MVPDPSKTSLGMEYFCKEGDDLWSLPDNELFELARHELQTIGLVSAKNIIDGCVVRVPKAYPIYELDYRGFLEIVKNYLNEYTNLQSIGRNGLHRYNNQDHSMLAGVLAVRNLMLGEHNDLWHINSDQEYIELEIHDNKHNKER